MKITFTEDAVLLDGQRVVAGQTIDHEDGAAFIANGIAVAAAETTKKKEE